MKFCDERIQKHLLNGGRIKRKCDSFYKNIHIAKNGYFVDDDYSYYDITKNDLTADDWEIIEFKYDWDKIIKDKVLCVFSDTEDFKSFNISLLTDIDKINYDEDIYKTNEGIMYDYCKPFNPAEFNIAKDLKEYEK